MKIYHWVCVPILALSLIVGCSQDKVIPLGTGLIGAYYGNSDFTNIKDAEILTSLDKVWNEETGHGNTWSGQWEGYLIAPVTGDVTLTLVSNKEASLNLGENISIHTDEESTEASTVISMKKGESYPIKIGYTHAGGGTGTLKVLWSWEGTPEHVIPRDKLFYNAEQARNWNWLPEPNPDQIDYDSFLKPVTENVIVYSEKGRFCGWPANNGVWSWGDEIVVGFTLAFYQEKEMHHSFNEDKPSFSVLARSLDGGHSWKMEDPENFFGDGGTATQITDNIDFTHAGFALRCSGNQFFYSYDRCKSWSGPFLFPDFGREKLTSRTDYLVSGADDCLFFLSTEDKNVQARLQDRAFCARTSDAGLKIEFLGWMTEKTDVRSVMPSTVRLSETHLISAMRRRFDEEFENKPRLPKNWIDVYESKDNGYSWHFLSKVADTDMGKHNGNPPSLVKLQDGRLCVTYGYRAVPYGIRARLSSDTGKTWSEEIHIRDDGRTYDLGYTRSIQRPDGKVVTIYYYTTKAIREQHIAASIWDPDNLYK